MVYVIVFFLVGFGAGAGVLYAALMERTLRLKILKAKQVALVAQANERLVGLLAIQCG